MSSDKDMQEAIDLIGFAMAFPDALVRIPEELVSVQHVFSSAPANCLVPAEWQCNNMIDKMVDAFDATIVGVDSLGDDMMAT